MIRIIAFLALCLLYVNGEAQSTKVKIVKETDFVKLETFTVRRGEVSVPKDQQVSLNEEQLYVGIKSSVQRELEARGYKFIEDTLADFVVDYVAGTFNVSETGNLGPLGGRPATDPTMVDQSKYWSEAYRSGMLILEIYRGKRDNIVWTSESTIDLTTPATDRTLAAIVAKSFKKFPAKNSKKKSRK